ncbi:hypothetical protein QQS21_003893 [Conoideocrella luteorostrata]|uniref:AGC-kinase C-terminal domain-containing protein n=1 Tax=Conoideocrella luteorostrata TaxID=1105319 RepID=A0AAJ0G200_9HYPO|nr:hypothetical protein QQS21_003893 [Conoideocrella luteorostrata]
MLSHLRFHRRGASNPSSPVPDHQQSFSPFSNNESPHTIDSTSPLDGWPHSAGSATAPTLPPITRVTSTGSSTPHERRNAAGSVPDNWPQQIQRTSYTGDTGFIGGVALQKYRRDVEAQHMTTRGEAADGGDSGNFEEASRSHIAPNQDTSSEASDRSQIRKMTSFSTPTDLQALNPPSNLGRRTAGARLPQDAPIILSASLGTANVETQRGKKGLPFLKNPMSTLLMRRRNNQNAPDLRPLPLDKKDEEPAYDPRIRGTRVHDFSAPRKPKDVYVAPVSDAHLTAGKKNHIVAPIASGETTSEKLKEVLPFLQTSSKSQTPSRVSSVSGIQSNGKSFCSKSELELSGDVRVVATTSQKAERESTAALPQTTSGATTVSEQIEPDLGISSSVRTNRSRKISLSEVSMSAIPRHMKSTSSRFSFDMAGAAKQEKLLEERHRQRELERKTNDDDGFRDSRFDDFDEEAFDYDAMMDDDGLEERIPGVNADFQEEDTSELHDACSEDDLDDQENFAGFVFQHSNPVSALASPYSGVMATPRDADGNIIGFALSKDTPGSSTFPIPLQTQGPEQGPACEDKTSGLGIHDISTQVMNDHTDAPNDDDLYYDDGMIGFDDDLADDLATLPDTRHQPFDESIFDDNDTDQFGRPVPGAFKQAQSLRRAAETSSMKRESDMTSRLSTQSAVSRSTTHTSLSAEVVAEKTQHMTIKKLNKDNNLGDSQGFDSGPESFADYQAALAAAAQIAAETGQFQRSTSPTSTTYQPEDEAALEIYGGDTNDPSGRVEDDFDFDDDAIIAEANASALANDSDGWYGQEFGFYSAPPSFHSASHAAGPSTAQDYEYVNGGFFGPGGVGGLSRSTSGRMISREPNLTPITERSEYSNRNSLMSLGYPSLSTSTPVVQSPGLAQLAMIADSGGDQMTLSALLRLRSKAWGGSQASLASSREGSPRSERGDIPSSSWPVNSLGTVGQINHNHSRKPSVFSAVSHDYDSDGVSGSGSPTMTMANIGFDHWQSTLIPEEEDATQMSIGKSVSESLAFGQGLTVRADSLPFTNVNDATACAVPRKSSSDIACQTDGNSLSPSNRHSFKGHRHKSSADSVSYVKEEDSGEACWVIERRRTAESGEVEVLEREIIEGSRI